MSMSGWKAQLESFESLLKEISEVREDRRLRFDRSCVIASDVAGQFYCEKKVEMRYVHGEVETEAMSAGTEAHEGMAEGAVKVEKEELWRKIYGKRPVLALEMFLAARHGDVILAGRPDSVLFSGGVPLVVFEYKFSKSSAAYHSYHVQAQVYCALLEEMGFDVSRLFYAVVVADPGAKGGRELRRGVVKAVKTNGQKLAVLSADGATIYVNGYNRASLEKDLEWALRFWDKSRDAEPSRNANKCMKCEYRDECKI